MLARVRDEMQWRLLKRQGEHEKLVWKTIKSAVPTGCAFDDQA
jgi:hypothetical protein